MNITSLVRIAISIHAPSRERQLHPKQGCELHGISIHAPSRERRLTRRYHSNGVEISIHAPSRERRRKNYRSPAGRHFNPRSLTGATLAGATTRSAAITFQSTLPHGSDQAREGRKVCKALFQSTLPHGSD